MAEGRICDGGIGLIAPVASLERRRITRSHCGASAIFAAFIAAAMAATSAYAAAMDRAVAISDPLVLRELDPVEQNVGDHSRSSLGLARMLGAPATSSGADIFVLPSMAALRVAIDREFDDYAARQDATTTAGTRLRLLDRSTLYSTRARFVLVGIVNRMDRAYKAPATCGEIRLIYRPVVTRDAAEMESGKKAARLPMTLNLVLNTRNADDALTCSEIARRWLAMIGLSEPARDIAMKLVSKGGALEGLTADHIDRIETNIQLARASDNPDDFEGRADYLMKVFRFDRPSRRFIESPMENQIDQARLLSDASLLAEFRNWISEPTNFVALDRGTIFVPEKFIATSAIVVTPQSEASEKTKEIVLEKTIIESLAKISESDQRLENVLSPAGFARRLDDITCAGCHQTRAIGGFHFTGAELAANEKSAVIAPASPHFIGDQGRRRDILTALRDGKPPDFSRGFSARPQARRSAALDGTTYLNGWGAHCYEPSVARPKTDKSFASWTCIDGLACQMSTVGASATRAGLCFPPN